jgi:hypothetical protein
VTGHGHVIVAGPPLRLLSLDMKKPGMLCRLVKPIEIDELRRWIDLVTQRGPGGATSVVSA